MVKRFLLPLVLWPALVSAQTVSGTQVRATTRAVIGGATFGTTSSPLRLVGLPTASGANVVIIDANGDLWYSTEYPRKAQSETVTGLWNFSHASGVSATSFTTTSRIYSEAGQPLALSPGSGGFLQLYAPAGQNIWVDANWGSGAGGSVLPNTSYKMNLGALTLKFMAIHAAELWVETLVAQDTIATIGGRILVGPTTVLTKDLAAGDGYVCVKHNQMVSGDRAYMEADGAVEFFAITSGPTTDHASCNASVTDYYYTVTRNLDSSGANNWAAGDALFNTGQTGNGFIDLYSVRGVQASSQYGPTIVGNVRASSTYNDWAPRWAIGNLRDLYGYGANTVYGVAMGDPAATNIVIDATNGIRIRNGTTNKLTADTSGNLSLVGNLTVNSPGIITASGGNLTIDSTGVRVTAYSGGTWSIGTAYNFVDPSTTSITAGALFALKSTGSGSVFYSTVLAAGRQDADATTKMNAVGRMELVACHGSGGCPSGQNRTLSWLDIRDGPDFTPTFEVALQSIVTLKLTSTAATFATTPKPSTDNIYALGANNLRWSNIYLNLPNDTAFGYLVVGNSSVDATRLAYYCGQGGTGSNTITIRKGDDSGSCTLTTRCGVITATTCAVP